MKGAFSLDLCLWQALPVSDIAGFFFRSKIIFKTILSYNDVAKKLSGRAGMLALTDDDRQSQTHWKCSMKGPPLLFMKGTWRGGTSFFIFVFTG